MADFLGGVKALRFGARTRGRQNTDRFLPVVAAALLVAAWGGFVLTDHADILQPTRTESASTQTERGVFSLCGSGKRTTCVVDGDTFHFGGDTVRIADIDTPEVRDYKCAAELKRGQQATARLLALMNAGSFTLEPADRDADRYGRKLRIVRRNGQSLGQVLVAEGLARTWDGARHPWCQG